MCWVVGVRAGETQTENLELTPRPHLGAITGKVVDRDGKPIAGAEISNHGTSSSLVRTTLSGDKGEFRLEKLFNREELVIQARGFSPRQMNISESASEPEKPVTITLQPGHSIRGTVIDERGEPLAGVSVTFDGQAGGGWQLHRTVKTDELGVLTVRCNHQP